MTSIKKAQTSTQLNVSTENTLGIFPTAVPEEELEEIRRKKIHYIFGATQTLKHIQSPDDVGTYTGIVQRKVQEHTREGNKNFSECKWEKAINCYTKALNLDPSRVELHLQKAEAFLQLCDFQSAILHLRKAYFISPMERHLSRLAFVLHLQGQCLYEQNVFLDALESFTRASELQPQNTLYRMRSIACLASMKKYNDCLQMVNEEVAQESTNPDLFVLRARLYEHFGKATLAFNNLREATTLDPEHSEAWALLEKFHQISQKARDQAVKKAAKGNLKGALLKINQSIDYDPLYPAYFLFRGNIMRRLKDFEAAIEDFLKAMELSKDVEEEEAKAVNKDAQKQLLLCYNDFAVHCYSKGSYEEAILLLNKAIKGEKNEVGLYINRGDCFMKVGQVNFGMADYLQALEMKPHNPSLQRRVALLYNEMGLQALRERRFAQAQLYFTNSIDNNPREYKFYLHRAKTRMYLQEVMGAKEDICTAMLLEPQGKEVHSVATKLFPGEPVDDFYGSKVADLAKTVLERKLASCPAPEVLDEQKSLSSSNVQPSNVYVQTTESELMSKRKDAEEEKKKKESEKKKLSKQINIYQKKSHQLNKQMKEVRSQKVSLQPPMPRLNENPELPEKKRTNEVYQWRNFSKGIGHF